MEHRLPDALDLSWQNRGCQCMDRIVKVHLSELQDEIEGKLGGVIPLLAVLIPSEVLDNTIDVFEAVRHALLLEELILVGLGESLQRKLVILRGMG